MQGHDESSVFAVVFADDRFIGFQPVHGFQIADDLATPTPGVFEGEDFDVMVVAGEHVAQVAPFFGADVFGVGAELQPDVADGMSQPVFGFRAKRVVFVLKGLFEVVVV